MQKIRCSTKSGFCTPSAQKPGGIILIFDPVAPPARPQQLRRGLGGLAGKVVGFVENGKPNFTYLLDDLAELLIGGYGAAAAVKRKKRGPGLPAPDAMMDDLATQCDAVITGSGD